MSKTRFNIAKPSIVAFLDARGQRIYRRSEIAELFAQNRSYEGGAWRLTQSLSVNGFIKLLLEHTKLRQATFAFPSRKETRYTWGDVSTYELVLSIRADSYLSHYTAMYVHDLTEQVPKTIYLNSEQTAKPKPVGPLQQDRIDFAYGRPSRVSKNFAEYGDYQICMLSGKQTGNLGVVSQLGPEGESLRVTNIERTLIDIAVRPVYAGGVFEVAGAFRRAKDKVSLNRLAATLKKLDYIYPYHQVIGFYLDQAGVYKQSAVARFLQMGLDFDFHLTHKMKEVEYSKKWRLFFPKGF